MIAPLGMRERIIDLIHREAGNAERGLPSRIIVKMNALVEPTVIDALYRASRAGVSIQLVIRGTCCLRPGVPGVSGSIRVISIVDKFLEHSRIFYFENAGDPEVLLGSADWMPRNFFRRVEVMFPIEDRRLEERVVTELLHLVLHDNVKTRELQVDGAYRRVAAEEGQAEVRSQTIFQALARESSRDGGAAAFRFVPILGPLGAPSVVEAASAHGSGDSTKRSRPPRVRSARARKRSESA